MIPKLTNIYLSGPNWTLRVVLAFEPGMRITHFFGIMVSTHEISTVFFCVACIVLIKNTSCRDFGHAILTFPKLLVTERQQRLCCFHCCFVSATQVRSPFGNAGSIVVVRQVPCRASCPSLRSSRSSWEENGGRPFCDPRVQPTKKKQKRMTMETNNNLVDFWRSPRVAVFQTFHCLKFQFFNFKGVCSTHCYSRNLQFPSSLVLFQLQASKNFPLPHVFSASFCCSLDGMAPPTNFPGWWVSRGALLVGVVKSGWMDMFFWKGILSIWLFVQGMVELTLKRRLLHNMFFWSFFCVNIYTGSKWWK